MGVPGLKSDLASVFAPEGYKYSDEDAASGQRAADFRAGMSKAADAWNEEYKDYFLELDRRIDRSIIENPRYGFWCAFDDCWAD